VKRGALEIGTRLACVVVHAAHRVEFLLTPCDNSRDKCLAISVQIASARGNSLHLDDTDDSITRLTRLRALSGFYRVEVRVLSGA
jgi:hypothetical protein